MAQIQINVSGRIPKYFFGVLNEKYRDEVKESLQYCNEADSPSFVDEEQDLYSCRPVRDRVR
jgi:hypothetical protein